MNATCEIILRQLKDRIFHPVYFLEGEEPYYIDLVSDYIEHHVLPESERSFNQTILYGKDTSIKEIRQRAMNYPMFSNYQVIIVKEAQLLKKWDELLSYLEEPVKTTILVICYRYENIDKRTKTGKLLKESNHTLLLTTTKLYDNQVPEWIVGFLKEKGYSIQPQASALLVEYVGNELSRIANELEKLMLNTASGKVISLDDIEKNIGISKEYNTFELSKAIGSKDVLKANRIVSYIIANPKSNPMVLILGSLYSYFSKIYLLNESMPATDAGIASLIGVRNYPSVISEYRTAAKNFPARKAKQVIRLLHEFDLRSKGVNTAGINEGDLVKELVYEILH